MLFLYEWLHLCRRKINEGNGLSGPGIFDLLMNGSARVLHNELFRASVHARTHLCVGKFEEMGKIIE